MIGQLTTEEIINRDGEILDQRRERISAGRDSHVTILTVRSPIGPVVELVQCHHDRTEHWHLCG